MNNCIFSAKVEIVLVFYQAKKLFFFHGIPKTITKHVVLVSNAIALTICMVTLTADWLIEPSSQIHFVKNKSLTLCMNMALFVNL